MAVREWYEGRELLLIGATSDVGRGLLEKILRCFRPAKVYVLIRSKHNVSKEDRIKSILQSPRFERLRQEDPNAGTRIKLIDGNLQYENLGMSKDDKALLKNVTVAFHAGGPVDVVYEFCQELAGLEVLAVARGLLHKHRHGAKIKESLENETIPDGRIVVVRIPFVGPAHREPMPGFVDILKGPTALMVGAGLALGDSSSEAEIIPVDTVVNTLIVAAWDRATKKDVKGAIVYNALPIGCTWNELIKKGRRANGSFTYPTFGVRGMTSVVLLHRILILLFEWLPSVICDTILSLGGGKRRILQEHDRVRNALRSLESISSKSWSVERERVRLLEKRLEPEDRAAYPLAPDIDIESYLVCAAAAARKYCVDHANVATVKTFRGVFLLALVFVAVSLVFVQYPSFATKRVETAKM